MSSNDFTKICPNCGRLYEISDNFCSECVGTLLVAIKKECPICGRYYGEDDNFCSNCVSVKLIPKGENKDSYPQYKIVRINDLSNLGGGGYEKLYGMFGFKGTPYYITQFDGRYFVTEIDGASGIKSFMVQDGKIENIRTHFFFDGHSAMSEKRKMEKY